MGCLRPATPGFIVTLTATILLAVVSFSVPILKSVYFLKANISQSGHSGSILFGTLGYCLELDDGTTCSKPSVGYELDINSLVGNKLPIKIPNVVVKWITYALVLHIVALILSAGSALFGLLAHVREMSMACCSTCVSGFAAGVALLAFIFDVVLFFLTKSRINAVGSATIGNAIWLTLAAWIMLFFSGCFYTLGRCCINKRKPRSDWGKGKPDHEAGPNFSEQLRLDAVKAEADRKARAKQKEGGLPAFYESQPLTGHIDGNDVYLDGDDSSHDHKSVSPTHASRPTGGGFAGGYVQGTPGNRAMDEYYAPSQQNNYPPQPRRQDSGHSYAPSTFSYHAPQSTSPPHPMPNTQYLGASNAYHPGQDYGHTAGGTTYHSAASHQQEPTNYTSRSYDPYQNNPYQPQPQQSYAQPYQDPYGQHRVQSPPMPTATPPGITQPARPPHDRSYTLGGDGYGENTVPSLDTTNPYTGNANPYTGSTGGMASSQPSQIAMDFSNPHSQTPTPRSPTSPRGPREHRDSIPNPSYEDSPPGYSPDGSGHVQGAWGKS